MGDPLKTAAQYAMLVGNDVSFGLPKLFLGDDYDRRLAEARRATGFGGALASTAANLAGAGGAIKGGLKVAGKTLPAVGTLVRGIRAHPWATAAGFAVPLGATAKYSGGEYGGAAPAAAAAPARSAAQQRQIPVNPLAEEAYARGAARKAAMEPPNFEQMGPPLPGEILSSLAAAQGGRVSLEQLDAIGQFAQRTAVTPGKMPGYKDVIGAQAAADIDRMFMRNQALAQQIRESGKVPEALQEKYGTDAKLAAQALWEDAEADLLEKRMRLVGVQESMLPEPEGN